jgi:hypothetical protein
VRGVDARRQAPGVWRSLLTRPTLLLCVQIVGSTVSWALADLILDVTIGEESATGPPHHHQASSALASLQAEQEEEHSEEDGDEDEASASQQQQQQSGVEMTSLIKRRDNVSVPQVLARATKPALARKASSAAAGGAGGVRKPEMHMTGDQDTAVAGLVTLVIVYIMCFLRWTSHRRLATEFEAKRAAGLDVAGMSSGVGGVWSPFHDFEWWIAALGGVLLFWHYQTLYWAYDTAPSTVINPLLQVSSTWVLIGTGIPAVRWLPSAGCRGR